MTVAAVILAASPASALADADGTPAVRRLADVAWSGGATPVVVCSFDPDGTVGQALANAEVTLVEPVAPERGPVGQIANGIDAATRLVADTDGRAGVAGPDGLGRRGDRHDPDRRARRGARRRHPPIMAGRPRLAGAGPGRAPGGPARARGRTGCRAT